MASQLLLLCSLLLTSSVDAGVLDRRVAAASGSSIAAGVSSTVGSAAAAASTGFDSNPTMAQSGPALNNTNDPHQCHIDLEVANGTVQNVFCSPTNGTTVGYNANVLVTWDSALFMSDAQVMIEVYSAKILASDDYQSLTDMDQEALYTTSLLGSSNGAAVITTSRNMVDSSAGPNGSEVVVVLALYENQGATPIHQIGPSIFVTNVDGNITATTGSSSGSSTGKKVGEGVGGAVGGVIIVALIICAILAFLGYRSKKRRSTANIGSDLSRNSSPEHTGHHRRQSSAASFAGLVGTVKSKFSSGHKRSGSYHDEPKANGTELQSPIKKKGGNFVISEELPSPEGLSPISATFPSTNTNTNATANNAGRDNPWEEHKWVSPTSPTSPTSPSAPQHMRTFSEAGDGNVFREEVERQKSARGW